MSLPRSARVLGLVACGSLACADLLGLDDPRLRDSTATGSGASSSSAASGAATASSGSGEGGRGAAATTGGEGGTATSSASTGGGGTSSSSTTSTNGGGGTGGDPGPCGLTGNEEPCKECVKQLCCPQLLACTDSSCTCWKMCVQEGTKDYVTCQTQCGGPSQPVVDLADCVQDLCTVCGL